MSDQKKLLIVEDDEQFRKSLEVVLKKHFEIDVAGSLDKALELISQKEYDVVSTDGAIPQHEVGSVGSHGTLYDHDYRGNLVVKAAKEKGIYVVCVSSEPDKIAGADKYCSKRRLDLFEYVAALKQGGDKK